MSNSYAAFFQTLTAALADPNKALVAPNNLIECVYRDFKPEPAQPYSVLNIPIPASVGTVSDLGIGAITFQDVIANNAPVTFNKHPGYGFKIPDFDEVRSAQGLRAMFLDEGMKKVLTNINGVIGALITSGNFAQVVTGTVSGSTSIEEFANAWQLLVDANVNVKDEGNLFYITAPAVYRTLLTDPSWGAYSAIGMDATSMRRTARFNPTFGVIQDYDRDIPQVSGNSYDNFFFHRNAIALVTRPLPNVSEAGARSETFYVKGIPFRVTLSYSHADLAYVVSVDAGYGVAVIRANHGVRVRSAV